MAFQNTRFLFISPVVAVEEKRFPSRNNKCYFTIGLFKTVALLTRTGSSTSGRLLPYQLVANEIGYLRGLKANPNQLEKPGVVDRWA